MTANDLLERLEGVRRSGRGWMARCPTHWPDKTPSLSVHEGDTGLLLKCWGWCELSAICDALGIKQRDLFYDAGTQRGWAPPKATKRRRYDWRTFANAVHLRAIDFRLHSEAVLGAARDLDISTWTDTDLDVALKVVCQAYRNLERADQLDRLDFDLGVYGLRKEQERGPRP